MKTLLRFTKNEQTGISIIEKNNQIFFIAWNEKEEIILTEESIPKNYYPLYKEWKESANKIDKDMLIYRTEEQEEQDNIMAELPWNL